MNIQNNNVNFTGLYLKTNNPMALSTKTINKMSQIVKERGGFINRLEKEENADVFISEKLDKVSLSHKTCLQPNICILRSPSQYIRKA